MLAASVMLISKSTMAAEENIYTDSISQFADNKWTGPYLGLNGGYAWGQHYITDLSQQEGRKWNAANWLIGAQIGYNWQYKSWLLGIESDLQYASFKGKAAIPFLDAYSKLDWFGTTRLRVGGIVNDTLFYGTAGLAYGENTVSFTDYDFFDPLDPILDRKHHFGWTAGVGVEHLVSASFSIKLEYLYTDLGNQKYFHDASSSDDIFLVGVRFNTIRAGVNFHF